MLMKLVFLVGKFEGCDSYEDQSSGYRCVNSTEWILIYCCSDMLVIKVRLALKK